MTSILNRVMLGLYFKSKLYCIYLYILVQNNIYIYIDKILKKCMLNMLNKNLFYEQKMDLFNFKILNNLKPKLVYLLSINIWSNLNKIISLIMIYIIEELLMHLRRGLGWVVRSEEFSKKKLTKNIMLCPCIKTYNIKK